MHLFDADKSRAPEARRLRAATALCDESGMFGDDLTRALHSEATWNVPITERLSCPIHLGWRTDCAALHETADGHDYQAAA
ncbi:hypothetical protein [Streptomyces sp. KL116D]|uniref:hypothetical protein n=1 Tax=Streptomyces sp. KL116D TaxID=3045152 RepID=UPI0035591AD0